MPSHRRKSFLIFAIVSALVAAGALFTGPAQGQAADRKAPRAAVQPAATPSAQAQSLRASRFIHRERPSDPPAPPAAANPGARSAGARIVSGAFTSVQVNVDSSGMNITGDAANEPSIAIDPTDPGKVTIGWRQFDSVHSNFRQAGHAYSQDGGETWTFPGVLTPGTFRSDPALDFSAGGIFYYYSLKGDFTCDMFISNDGGVSWQGPIPAWGGDKNWIGVDRTKGIGSGNIYCTWSGYDNFTRSTDGGQTYRNPIYSEAYWGTISVGPGGDVFVCGWTGGSSAYVQRSSNAQNPNATPSWDFTKTVNLGGSISYGGGPNPGGLLGQIWIATNHAPGHTGEVYLLASVDPSGGDPLDVHFVRSTDNGQTWSSPVRVNDDPSGNGAWQWFGTMSVAPNGRIDVVWNDTRNSGQDNISELYYAYSEDSGATWSKNLQVTPSWDSHIGWPNQDKIGDYYDMVSLDDYAVLAYAATFNGEQDVYFVKLYPDISLKTDTREISAAAGGTAGFTLDAGSANKNRSYFLVGSAGGTSPGTPLPGGAAILPLVWDNFTQVTINWANSPVFKHFMGVLDASGAAAATLDTQGPLSPGLIGQTRYFAYALNSPWDFASNPVAIEIVP